MSGEIKKRLKEIEAVNNGCMAPAPTEAEVNWFVTTVREQLALAQKLEDSTMALQCQLDATVRRAEKAEAACAAMRAALLETSKAFHLAAHQGDGFDDTEAEIFARAKAALATDAAGWASPELVARVIEAIDYSDPADSLGVERECRLGAVLAELRATQQKRLPHYDSGSFGPYDPATAPDARKGGAK